LARPSKYPPEFRREAIEWVKTSERPRVEVARSFGVSDSTLANWMQDDRDAQSREADPDGLSLTEREELRALRKEVIELWTEREILRRQGRVFRPGGDAVSASASSMITGTPTR
jgi:transposase